MLVHWPSKYFPCFCHLIKPSFGQCNALQNSFDTKILRWIQIAPGPNNPGLPYCVVCGEKETTEHLLECQYYSTVGGTDIMTIADGEMESTEWLIKAARKMDFIQEIRQQHLSV